MSFQPVVQYASRTDVGMRRSANQDSLAVRMCSAYEEWARIGHLFIVADGMGGHSVGDLASRITVETLPLAFFKSGAERLADRLTGAIEAANRAINDKARENPEFSDMGTTCSVLSLSAEGAWIGHVGDSRIYRIRGDVIEQLTFDHSLQWEMMRQGRATAERSEMLHPRNVITRCLGPDKNVEIDVEGPFDVRPGDRFLLCSDGLTGHLTDNEIGAIVAGLPPDDACRFLIDLANCRGGTDNSTVVLAVIQNYPPIESDTVESLAAKARTTNQLAVQAAAPERVARRRMWSRLAMTVFLLLAGTGLSMMILGQREKLGLALVVSAIVLGFIQLVMSARRTPTVVIDSESPPAGSGDALLGCREPALSSPYRRDSAALRPEFLAVLADAQSQLAAVAEENGWDLNIAQLRQPDRTATDDGKRTSDALAEHARAIRILMKEFAVRLRPRS